MKQYLVVRHRDGMWITLDKQFDNKADAKTYAEYAKLGDPDREYIVYEQC